MWWNVVFISKKANTAKSSYQCHDLYKLADWLHDKEKEVLNALRITDAQVPKTNGRTVKKNAAHGVVHGAGVGKDCDGSHHYQESLDLGVGLWWLHLSESRSRCGRRSARSGIT